MIRKTMSRLLSTVVIFICLPCAHVYTYAATPDDTGYIKVEFKDYYLTVVARMADINKLVQDISDKTGVKVILESPVNKLISVEFEKYGFAMGMEKILEQLGTHEYRGDFQLGKTFAGSTYTIRKITDEEISERTEKASSLTTEGEALLSEGNDYKAYLKFIEALRVDRKYLPAHRNLVIIYQNWQAEDRLIKRLEKIVRFEPEDPANYRKLADACKTSEYYNDAIKYYEIYLSKVPESRNKDEVQKILNMIDTPTNRSYSSSLTEAEELLANGQIDSADALLQQIKNSYPEKKRAHELLARVYEYRKKYDEAVELRKKIEKLNPEDFNNLILLGDDLRRSTRKELSNEYFERARAMTNSAFIRSNMDKTKTKAESEE